MTEALPSGEPRWRALIADDERLMREQLRSRLAQVWPELQIIAEAVNGEQAIALIDEHEPDISFLDIRMPGLSGLEVARRLGGRCAVVFVTAYDEYALQAFEEGAIDYLVKPVQAARLERLVSRWHATRPVTGLAPQSDRVRNLQGDDRVDDQADDPLPVGPQALARMSAMLEGLGRRLNLPVPARPPLRIIQASVGQEIRMVPVEDVLFFMADERYTRVQTREVEVLIRTPIRDLLVELDPDRFWQIHRSTLVNRDAIASVSRDESGRRFLHIRGHSQRLEISRSFAGRFRAM